MSEKALLHLPLRSQTAQIQCAIDRILCRYAQVVARRPEPEPADIPSIRSSIGVRADSQENLILSDRCQT